MNIDEFCTKLENRLKQIPEAEERLDAAVNALCQAFSVSASEVAVFALDPASEMFSFLWPVSLKSSGAIPITSTNSLVARTAKEKKSFVNNAFASTPHASFFERFRQRTAPSHPIQKIMSVPLEKDGGVGWVIQLSRKGEDAASAGKDFTPPELNALERIGKVIAAHL